MRTFSFRIFGLLLILGATACGSPQKIVAPATAAPIQLRVLSYNIHHGEGVDGKLDLERIARVIQSANPDFVALQEVDDRTTRTRGVNQAVELGRLTGMNAVFAQAMSFQGGGYGQAILSKSPSLARTVINLPQRTGREPRIGVMITTKLSERVPELIFASTHLDHEVEEIRIQQATTLESVLSTNRAPTILAGDFNATPESPVLKIFSRTWLDVALTNPQSTIPSTKPTKRIDYILLRPQTSWRVIQTEVLEEEVASDHRPVLTTIELITP